ncbi:MAG: hypothetical protein WCB46_02380 [Methanoregula sp.]
MTFTQNSDLYVAVQDAGINRVLHHVMVQRPSLFNYGSILPAANPRPICRDIPTVPQVVQAANPLITEMDPLPVIQTPITLDYIVQMTGGAMDFFPGNVFSLPPELNPPLADQQFAVHFQVCAGLICQPRMRIWPPVRRRGKQDRRDSDIDCFCLDLFATGGCGITGLPGQQSVAMNVAGIEIPELKPDGMEEAMECYALLALNRGILPKVADAISAVAFRAISLPGSLGSLTLSASTAVPHNPAVEDNQFKAFVNLDNITLNLPFPSSGGGGSSGGGSGGTVTRTVRPRTRTGTLDLTAAVSAGTFEKIFKAVVQGFRFSKSGDRSFGIFSAHYEVAAHLEGGTLELRDDGTIVIKELDVKWDKLRLDIGIDIPEQCVGGGEVCVVPPYPSCDVPIVGCAACVTIPSFCFFSGSPDITIPIDLSGLITSEVTFSARIEAFYGVGSGVPNRWQIVVVPTLPFDLDIIDIADTVGDLFKNLVQGAIDNLLSSLGAPDWAIDLIDGILGGIDNIIRVILDIPDDIGEWLLDMISQIGIFSSLLNDLYDYIALRIPAVFEIEDPYQVLEQDGILIPVKIPIEFIGVSVNSHEMVIEGDVGN